MNNIFNFLNAIKGNKIVALTYAKEVKTLKSCPIIGDITKVTNIICQFGYSYENAVKNRINKAGGDPENFTAETLPWGKWLVPNKFITHNDTIYARFYTMKNGKSESAYYINGEAASAEETEIIKQYLPKRSKSAKQSAAGLEENQVTPFNIKIDNILNVKCK